MRQAFVPDAQARDRSRSHERRAWQGDIQRDMSFFQELVASELKQSHVDTWSAIPKPNDKEDPDTMHLPREWFRNPMKYDKGKGVMISLIIDEADFDAGQGLRPTISSCMVASIARKRKLEIKER